MRTLLRVLQTRQGPTESVGSFADRLRTAADDLKNQGKPAIPEIVLRDAFIKNVRDMQCRQMLVCRCPVSLEEAKALAVQWEKCDMLCHQENDDEEDTVTTSTSDAGFEGSASTSASIVAGLRGYMIKRITSTGIPRSLAIQLVDLLETAEEYYYLPRDRHAELFQMSPNELREYIAGLPKPKHQHGEFLTSIEIYRHHFPFLQVRVNEALQLHSIPTPKWLYKFNRDVLPSNLIIPGQY